jgi:3-methyladenine DNA glycosylase Mpg
MADVINVSINNSGVPSGGSAGQLLRKKSGLSYDLEWVNAGASTAQTLSLGGAGNRELSISGGNTVTLPVGSNSVITNFSLSGNILTLELDNASPVTVDLTAIGITVAQSNAIVANTAKTGITVGQASAITANTNKVGITPQQASDITANNSKVGITVGQASAIVTNTAKVGITTAQSNAIVANTAKTGITAGQSNAIVANTNKVGITTAQANEIIVNNGKVGITAAQSNAITANTAKVGITPQQSSDITDNNSKVGITVGQASAIIANSAKVGIPTGGTANQVLSKTSATDYATSWVTPSGGSGSVLPFLNYDFIFNGFGGRFYGGFLGQTSGAITTFAGTSQTNIISSLPETTNASIGKFISLDKTITRIKGRIIAGFNETHRFFIVARTYPSGVETTSTLYTSPDFVLTANTIDFFDLNNLSINILANSTIFLVSNRVESVESGVTKVGLSMEIFE